jgi:hypothetical protein
MPVIACTSCGHKWLLKADRLGQRVKCPKCKARVQTEAPPKRKLPVAAIIAAAVGVLVLMTGAILTAVFLFGGGQQRLGGGGDEAALDITRAAKAVKAGESPAGSPFDPARGDTGPWKVQPQAVEPAKDQLSLFAWPIDLEPVALYPTEILFGDTASRKAAVLVSRSPNSTVMKNMPLRWVRYDLTKREPSNEVKLSPYWSDEAPNDDRHIHVSPWYAALSPDGERLLVHLDKKPYRFHVWSGDGKKLPEFQLPDENTAATWLAFLTNDHAAVRAGATFFVCDVTSGKVVRSFDAAGGPPFALSPDRKLLALKRDRQFMFLDVTDGSLLGSVTPPMVADGMRGWEAEPGEGAAFSLDGSHFATCTPISNPLGYNLNVVNWDMKTGQPVETTFVSTNRHLGCHVTWCGPRQVLLGEANKGPQYYLDLDFPPSRKPQWEYYPTGPRATRAPDGRIWEVAGIGEADPQMAKERFDLVKTALGDSPHVKLFEKQKLVFSAYTVPHEDTKNRIEAYKTATKLRSRPVRIVAGGKDAAFTRRAAEAMADSLAAVGCKVSPQETTTARLTLSGVENRQVEKRSPTGALAMVELVPGKAMDVKIEILDPEKKLLWGGQFLHGVPDSRGDATEVLKTEVLQRIRQLISGRSEGKMGEDLPRIFVGSLVGIDGVFAPIPREEEISNRGR